VTLMWLLLMIEAARVVNQSHASAARCVMLAESPSARVAPSQQIAPGPPPLVSFRYYEGRMHHRYGGLDLVLDDAGH
jgi:hypothetical protein